MLNRILYKNIYWLNLIFRNFLCVVKWFDNEKFVMYNWKKSNENKLDNNIYIYVWYIFIFIRYIYMYVEIIKFIIIKD